MQTLIDIASSPEGAGAVWFLAALTGAAFTLGVATMASGIVIVSWALAVAWTLSAWLARLLWMALLVFGDLCRAALAVARATRKGRA